MSAPSAAKRRRGVGEQLSLVGLGDDRDRVRLALHCPVVPRQPSGRWRRSAPAKAAMRVATLAQADRARRCHATFATWGRSAADWGEARARRVRAARAMRSRCSRSLTSVHVSRWPNMAGTSSLGVVRSDRAGGSRRWYAPPPRRAVSELPVSPMTAGEEAYAI